MLVNALIDWILPMKSLEQRNRKWSHNRWCRVFSKPVLLYYIKLDWETSILNIIPKQRNRIKRDVFKDFRRPFFKQSRIYRAVPSLCQLEAKHNTKDFERWIVLEGWVPPKKIEGCHCKRNIGYHDDKRRISARVGAARIILQKTVWR